jgi:hypothetical protein
MLHNACKITLNTFDTGGNESTRGKTFTAIYLSNCNQMTPISFMQLIILFTGKPAT